MKILLFYALAATFFGCSMETQGAKTKLIPLKKVLVVFSSASEIIVNLDKEGSAEHSHRTGFFLPELMTPLQMLIENGYQPTYASPQGTSPVLDKVSDSPFFYKGDRAEHRKAKGYCIKLGICSASSAVGKLKTLRLEDVIAEGLDQYKAVLFPGGHAPMADLYKDKSVSMVLKHFHEYQKPTALICHAPVALLATISNPSDFGSTLEKLNESLAKGLADDAAMQSQKLNDLRQNWIYKNYKLSVFTTSEEIEEEPGGNDDILGGYVKFYPDQALEIAGAKVQRAANWKSQVVRDRELLTGQNPFSDREFAEKLMAMLNEKK
ncbi:type 1 glutamine amidotransferase domain-containing protein [Oligoflexaceae bacterium]|nr:type 1 glutamine amidotransferase domain-containing protein [Oligoflexaceae bacterium]